MATTFLTGATGMVGREILARALADSSNDAVYCLVRPGKGKSAQERLDAQLDSLGVKRDGRAIAVAGDVEQPELGLSDATRTQLAGVTNVIHCAATVTFDHPLEEARKINVEGTKAVIELSRKLPKLARLDAVSTAYVAGKRSDLVREPDLEHGFGFHNTYEQTKYESEQLLRRAMADLPIAVHRPSIVVGDSRTGKTGAYKVLYWPLKVIARGWLPVIPYDPEGVADIVPVDYVADAVMALAKQPETIGGTFHLAAGPGRDATIGALAAEIFRRFDRRPPMRIKPLWFRNVARPVMMLLPFKNVKRTLESGLVYRPYFELRLRFDTTRTDKQLAPVGVRCPPVMEYFGTIIDTALRSDFGKRAA